MAEQIEWLTSKEAAAFTGVKRVTLYRWIKAGYLKGYQTPSGRLRIKKADLIRIREVNQGGVE